MNRLRKNIAQIYFEILKEPRNAGRRVSLMMDFFRWKLLFKHFYKRWTIPIGNRLRSVVYPDHDAGEVNIWTRKVDLYALQFGNFGILAKSQNLFATPKKYFHRSIISNQDNG